MSQGQDTRGQKGGKSGNPAVEGVRFRFTKDSVADLEPGPRPYYAWDAKEHGLCVLVAPSGTKTFFYRYKVKGQSKRFKLGRFPGLTVGAAQSKTVVHRGAVESGADPAEVKRERRGELSVSELIALYVSDHLTPNRKPKAVKEAEQLTRDYLADLVGLRLSDLTRKRVKEWHRSASKRSKIRANRALEVLSAGCSFALEEENDLAPASWGGVNPCHKLKGNPENLRNRVLSKEETGRLLRAIEGEHADLRDFFKMLLYTGARKGNVQAMKWADLDLDARSWTIEAAESKSGDEMQLALIDDAVKLLRARKTELDALIRRAAKPVDATRLTLREAQHRAVEVRKAANASTYVFPGRGAAGHLVEPKMAWGRVCKRAKIVKKLRIHDLRRTVGTRLAEEGANVFMIQAALGHKSLASSKPYIHPDLAPVRTALEGVAAAFAKARADAEADAEKVTPIGERGRS